MPLWYQGNFEVELDEIGDTWQLEGILIGNGENSLAMVLPFANVGLLDLWAPSIEQWETWLKQSDDPITKVYNGPDKRVVKAIFRKAERQVDEGIKWQVYQRDNYICVYCGSSGIPMTVDHYLAQALGGLTMLDNLRTSCRKCNKLKANKTIDEWIVFAKQKGLNDGAKIPS